MPLAGQSRIGGERKAVLDGDGARAIASRDDAGRLAEADVVILVAPFSKCDILPT